MNTNIVLQEETHLFSKKTADWHRSSFFFQIFIPDA
jgi:hypothetical protein